MKKEVILVISAMMICLTFCNIVIAHPGHGEHYPEEITNDTTASNPTTTPSTETTTSSKTVNNAKKSTVTNEESSQIKNTDSQNTDNQAGNQPVEEVTDPNSTTNATSSTDSESSPWNIIGPIGGVIAGFAVIGLLFKSGLLK